MATRHLLLRLLLPLLLLLSLLLCLCLLVGLLCLLLLLQSQLLDHDGLGLSLGVLTLMTILLNRVRLFEIAPIKTYWSQSPSHSELVELLRGELVQLHAHGHAVDTSLHVGLESLLSEQGGLPRLLLLMLKRLLLPHRSHSTRIVNHCKRQVSEYLRGH